MKIKSRFYQQGAETLEFAFMALFYFTLLFAIFEFSRALHTWGLLAEATRRGAKLASICPYQSPIPAKVAVFDVRNGLGNSPIIPNFSDANIAVRYLDNAGLVVNVGVGGAVQADIEFVEVTINVNNPYQYQMIFTNLFQIFIPTWTGAITSPTFQTTVPAESLGADPTFLPGGPTTTCDF